MTCTCSWPSPFAGNERVGRPAGYFIVWGGQFENQRRAQRRLMVVVPLCLALVFLLLYTSFDSVRSALLIILNVPTALIGGLLALLFSGQYLSVPSSVGFIALLLARGIGSEVQRPLATVVVGGLVSSTLLTLLVVPALYGWFAGHGQPAGSGPSP